MKPDFRVTVGTNNITELIAERLISLTVTDEAGVKSDRVEIVLDDRDQRLDLPPTKADITVSIGYVGRLVDKGKYVVEEIEVEGPDRRLTIRANSTGATKGAGAAREKSWNDTTIGDIARSIAGRHGWQPSIGADIGAVKVKHADQTENDLQFLSRLASENGGVAKVVSGRLIVSKHSSGKSVTGQALQNIDVHLSDGFDWVMTIAERGNYDGVKAQYYDLKKAKLIDAVAGDDTKNTHLMAHPFKDKKAAEEAAKSKLQSLRRGKATFTIKSMPGNPALFAEGTLNAIGFRNGVDGKWTINKVTHTISEAGYSTAVECETPEAKKTEIKAENLSDLVD